MVKREFISLFCLDHICYCFVLKITFRFFSRFFLYVFLAACAVLILVVAQQFVVSFTVSIIFFFQCNTTKNYNISGRNIHDLKLYIKRNL